ncbi:hypothetical protein ACFFTM_16685 [Pseudoduganella plicata]|uniref:Chemotaxis protein n=1 Tax=Pseudoduganella plicata TaxID=321984 RepID=A0A4P7BJ92_9BURK|nr:hypothetical protein [Pseudoduganella plicata]QBQ38974.1 hypothetical protein E1742_24595 [Pseudoduganella plicata]GGY86172.1 hypothetical protein GCM10007388_19180 [Pseudoduganella plicata]
MRKAGLPGILARLPVWVLCLYYCFMMHGKTIRIDRVAERIEHWLETVTALSHNATGRTELIDTDRSMRNDIESTKRTLLTLRELCVDVASMFHSIGFTSRMLEQTQRAFLDAVDDACITASTLQRALEGHDNRAIELLRRLDACEHAVPPAPQPGESERPSVTNVGTRPELQV